MDQTGAFTFLQAHSTTATDEFAEKTAQILHAIIFLPKEGLPLTTNFHGSVYRTPTSLSTADQIPPKTDDNQLALPTHRKTQPTFWENLFTGSSPGFH